MPESAVPSGLPLPATVMPTGADRRVLRLLSYNIQTGITSERYRHYLTNSWKHVLPHAGRLSNLDRIAEALTQFDLVGLQEVDSGSLRTGFVNQTEYLAERAGFPYWYHQVNRRVGAIAQHSNGLLSRLPAHDVGDYKLPGLPGRGVLMARFGTSEDAVALFIIHLALGRRARLRQLAFLREKVTRYRYAIVMGDLNCDYQSKELAFLVQSTSLHGPAESLRTFPSWSPRRHIDHILVSAPIKVTRAYVPAWQFSDHLPIAVEVTLPNSLGV